MHSAFTVELPRANVISIQFCCFTRGWLSQGDCTFSSSRFFTLHWALTQEKIGSFWSWLFCEWGPNTESDWDRPLTKLKNAKCSDQMHAVEVWEKRPTKISDKILLQATRFLFKNVLTMCLHSMIRQLRFGMAILMQTTSLRLCKLRILLCWLLALESPLRHTVVCVQLPMRPFHMKIQLSKSGLLHVQMLAWWNCLWSWWTANSDTFDMLSSMPHHWAERVKCMGIAPLRSVAAIIPPSGQSTQCLSTHSELGQLPCTLEKLSRIFWRWQERCWALHWTWHFCRGIYLVDIVV